MVITGMSLEEAAGFLCSLVKMQKKVSSLEKVIFPFFVCVLIFVFEFQNKDITMWTWVYTKKN